MLKREFKVNLKSLIIWSVILIVLFSICFMVYPSIMSSDKSYMLNEMLNTLPEEMLKAFNMDLVGIDSVFGWFQTEGMIFLILLGGLYSALLGSTILVKEENDKTIEFLYSKPITRNKILNSKIICGVINILIFTTLIALFNFIGLLISNDIEISKFLLLSFTPLFIFYTIFFITIFVSTFFHKTRKTIMIGIAFVLVSYFLQVISNMGENINFIKYFSVLSLVNTRSIIATNSLEIGYYFASIFIMVICIIGTYIRYNKKELI